jgi:hypothetical protein
MTRPRPGSPCCSPNGRPTTAPSKPNHDGFTLCHPHRSLRARRPSKSRPRYVRGETAGLGNSG